MIKKWLTGAAVLALTVCMAGCATTTATLESETEQTQELADIGLLSETQAGEKKLTMSIIPQDAEAFQYCCDAVNAGVLGLHNNEDLEALIEAQETGKAATYRTTQDYMGMTVVYETSYKDGQYNYYAQLFSGDEMLEQVSLGYKSLTYMQNSDGQSYELYLLDPTDEDNTIPYVDIGAIWNPQLVMWIDMLRQ